MEEKKIKVVITDDHKLFRKGVVALLSDLDFVNVIGDAENGIELLNLLSVSNSLPDVILLDIHMPEMDGIEAQKKIREIYPDIKIIILTMQDDEQLILHLIEEGVDGYLLKNADPDEMELAIKRVVNKGLYFSSDITELIVRGISKNKASENYELINDKELVVLKLLCREKTAAEIAAEINLSVRTIEGYRKKLMEKSGARNLAGLVVFAIKNELVTI